MPLNRRSELMLPLIRASVGVWLLPLGNRSDTCRTEFLVNTLRTFFPKSLGLGAVAEICLFATTISSLPADVCIMKICSRVSSALPPLGQRHGCYKLRMVPQTLISWFHDLMINWVLQMFLYVHVDAASVTCTVLALMIVAVASPVARSMLTSKNEVQVRSHKRHPNIDH